jgi:hypothetical protein
MKPFLNKHSKPNVYWLPDPDHLFVICILAVLLCILWDVNLTSSEVSVGQTQVFLITLIIDLLFMYLYIDSRLVIHVMVKA